jgi:polysaccharide deacetylase family protein (PEP-CTERM system associated)
MTHAFTVDVEDWHHGIPITAAQRGSAEARLEHGMDRLLETLGRHQYRATFFLLGPVVEQYPHLVRSLAAAGHEVGCHGWSHDFVYSMTPARFREETQRAVDVITSCTGLPVRAYRAAYFSITRPALWALEVLTELGFHYDSSIFPVRNWRYGIEDFDPRPQLVQTPSGAIYEFPVSVRRVGGRNFPVAGGAYFRLYPYWLTRSNVRAAERRGEPTVFYLHPWELDPEHPRLSFQWKAHLTHYANLSVTAPRLERLLNDFSFGPLGEVLDGEFARSRS